MCQEVFKVFLWPEVMLVLVFLFRSQNSV